MTNLVLNGFDSASKENVSRREVRVTATPTERGGVRVAIQDSGEGINSTALPRMFDAFFTTQTRGMGMGLAIVRSIVENHGGRIWASNADVGAILEFELPARVGRRS